MRQLKISSKITVRESESLEKYLSDISRIPVLTPEEEVGLARKIRSGDQDALRKLTEANLRFVVSVAKQYQNQGLSLSDLINEGNIGLVKAARRFDETKGFKFISYAVWWIRQSILQGIVENSRIVRMPANKAGAYHRLHAIYSDFVQEYERDPSPDEMAELANMHVKDAQAFLNDTSRHYSLDAPMPGSDDGSMTMLDTLQIADDTSPTSSLMEESVRQEIEKGLEKLPPRELEIVASYYGLKGYTQMSVDEIAEYYDLSRERVRQIKERALRRLRKVFDGADLTV